MGRISEKEISSFVETLSDTMKKRTIGLELEFSNGDKELIKLPTGYKHTDNKFSGHFNTTTIEIKNNARYGGEINTKPIQLNKFDLDELADLNDSIWLSGGKLNWYIEIHIHLYIKDMPIEDIHKINDAIFLLGNLNWQVFQIPEWNNTAYATPLMKADTHKKVDDATNIAGVANAFANGSARGFHRPYISMAQIETIGTIEYRHFSGTTDMNNIWEYIKFSYRFIDWAIHCNIEEKHKLKTESSFIETFKIDKTFLPTPMKPFIYAEEPSNNMTNIGEMFNKPRPVLSTIKKAVNGKRVLLSGSFNFDLEQVLDDSEITLYTHNAYTHFMYDIINNDLDFKFPEGFEHLDYPTNTTKAEKLARVILFLDLQKKAMNKSLYAKRHYENMLLKQDKILMKMVLKTSKIVLSLENRVKLVHGSFNDMVEAQEKDQVIIYHYEEPSVMRALHNKAVKFFDYKVERIVNDFSLITEFKNYVFVSRNAYLPYHLAYTDGRNIVYTDLIENVVRKIASQNSEPIYYHEIPHDYKITHKSKIKFMKAKGSEVDYIREKYLSKNIIMGRAIFCYLWFVDDYLIGASMLDFPKRKIGSGIVWLKSDFVVTNLVPKLSKLLIIAILSTEFRKEISIRFKENVKGYVTNVFTNKPVSMKYRGVFKLHTRENGKLIYVGEAGKFNRLKVEVLQKYLNSVK